MKKATLDHLFRHLSPQSRVVMRVDFNVPIKNQTITDHNRISSTVPTIKQLLEHNPRSLVLLSHHGRPNGQRVTKNSLKPVIEPLQEMLGREVTFLQDCIGTEIQTEVHRSQQKIFLCENVRYHPQQEGSIKDPDGKKIKSKPQAINSFRQELSKLGDCFVNDAFGSAHRAHSSVVGIKHKYRVAGRLMQKEIEHLGSIVHNKDKKILAILGGSKVADKIQLIQNLIGIAKEIIIGGGMSFPFLKHLEGHQLGNTKIAMPEDVAKLDRIMKVARDKGVKIHFPVDGICAQTLTNTSPTIVCDNQDTPEGWQIFDIGPKTLRNFESVLDRADLIFWNGPVGVFELENFQKGSMGLLKQVVKRTREGAMSVIGGGDTGNLVKSARLNLNLDISYISTGGGASLQFIQGLKLPGVQNLSQISDLE